MSNTNLISIPQPPQTKSCKMIVDACRRALSCPRAIKLAGGDNAESIVRVLQNYEPGHNRQAVLNALWAVYNAEFEVVRLDALQSPHFFKLPGATKETLQSLSGLDHDQRDELVAALSSLDRIQRQRERAKRRPRVYTRHAVAA